MLRIAARIALTHHEAWDSSEHPRGLRGKRIPQEGPIAAVADVYDALCSERSYKHAHGAEYALAAIAPDRGHRLDPSVYDALERRLDEIVSLRAEVAAGPTES
ncbi:MAG TPA: HD domain-containing phosphohydrolase [Planctomycetota bacterium]|nr:HD domain-containing phosphohydrolase [Planctomycetota bacterium]